MAYQTISLPTLLLTSSMPNTSTAAPGGASTIPAVDISDAVAIAGFCNGATTAPGYQIQVAFTSESTATFVTLTQQSTGVDYPYYLSSAASAMIPVVGKQARFGSSAAHTSTGVFLVWVKQIQV